MFSRAPQYKSAGRIRAALVSCAALAALTIAGAAHADSATKEIWALSGQATIAHIDLLTNAVTVYGDGMYDPGHGNSVGIDWTTIAVSPSRNIYLTRRYFDDLFIYTVPADGIVVDGFNKIRNLTNLGALNYNGSPLGGNVDGFTAGPDGNVYFSAYQVSGAGSPPVNGLYRFNVGSGTTDFVGTFAGDTGPSGANSFYTDLAFDPITGDLVGTGYDANGGFTLYRIPSASVVGQTNQTFAFNYFTPAWQSHGFLPFDGIAFDATNGDLYLSQDGGAVYKFDRNTAALLSTVPGTSNIGWDLALQARTTVITVPEPGAVATGIALFGGLGLGLLKARRRS